MFEPRTTTAKIRFPNEFLAVIDEYAATHGLARSVAVRKLIMHGFMWECVNGVYGYLGYPTAWFMDRLQGDTYAHGPFVNPTGEMFSETASWEHVSRRHRAE